MDSRDAAHASLADYLTESQAVLSLTRDADLSGALEQAVDAIVASLRARRPLLVCGNGGSMADALHIAGELTARFLLDRSGLPAVALGSNPSTLTAWSNDVDYASQFAREVEALGSRGGALLALSTSGNSANVIAALDAARSVGLTTIGLTGEGGGRMAPLCDILLAVPCRFTPLIQQVHQALYHYLCLRVEARMA
ncbi:D-sedoheptulose-7-phosphate isomerase [Roseospira visakhapatnamensis]|uniref:D-sedoheptulose 7-phosphate isomerase n=1 Tax=Roseospira visakhapatnamensis TaxID=390880 RepID=A0A7W6W9R1_9PROT|nr:SIS domain-containing protein [Roseospira visakhapatnamensis]MBB4265697.1 D-sedoheptulose 7-phosphate isomerase [Roseospira visakhapatnamensis]